MEAVPAAASEAPVTSEALPSSSAAAPAVPAVAAAVFMDSGVPEGQALPEGYAMMIGDDGEHYVTVVQDGQTYAIPASEYQAMQQEGGGTLTIQPAQEVVQGETSVIVQQQPAVDDPQQAAAAPVVVSTEFAAPAPVLVPVAKPPGTLQPVPGPPPMFGSPAPLPRPVQAQPQPILIPQNREFKPIKVDNWGIFLLNRLQNYFQKKEHCDLNIRFPTKNAQIKVHSLVINACTDYFLQKEKEGKIIDGVVDMDPEFGPEAVAPIIRFMYTGRLDLKEGMFARLHHTATKLNMSVLTKLMDAQLVAPQVVPKKKPVKKKTKPDDPLKQMKKIKKIERQFNYEEKKAKILAKLDARGVKKEPDHGFGEDTLPGKKLPIWKKRSNQQDIVVTEESFPVRSDLSAATEQAEGAPVPAQESPMLESKPMLLTPVSGPPAGAKLVPMASVPPELKSIPASPLKVSSAAKAYERKSMGEKPKVPRQIREIQENLTFEKIRRTGTKNVTKALPQEGEEEEATKEMTSEEMKEFMEEQRKRLQQVGNDDDMDDFYDNDAGIDYDDDDGEEEEAGSENRPKEASPPAAPVVAKKTVAKEVTPAKPILKTDKTETPPEHTPRKSVRFSLRPGGTVTTPTAPKETPQPTTTTPVAATPEKSPREVEKPAAKEDNPQPSPKTRGRAAKAKESAPVVSDQDLLDDTVDEFNRAVEEEEQAAAENAAQEELGVSRSRSGRAIIKKKLDGETPVQDETPRRRGRSPKEKEEPPSPPAKKRKVTPDEKTNEEEKDETEKNTKSEGSSSVQQDQAKVVQEVLKKYPDLFKNNKEVKLKVMAKDANGKPTMQYITLRAAQGEASDDMNILNTPEGVLGLREIPKVRYTGRRGRPKKLKPGERDPHEAERRVIEERLQSAAGIRAKVENLATLDQVAKQETIHLSSNAAQLLDPSSEAEALSNVASGIATSLGLVAVEQQQEFANNATPVVVEGPLADLENFEDGQGQTVLVNYAGSNNGTQLVVTSDGGLSAVAAPPPPGGAVQASPSTTELYMAQGSSSAMVVQQDSKGTPNIEDAMAKIHSEQQKKDGKGKKTISQIAMDWEEEEEED